MKERQETLSIIHNLNYYSNDYTVSDICNVAKISYSKLLLLENSVIKAKKDILDSISRKDDLETRLILKDNYNFFKRRYEQFIFDELSLKAGLGYSRNSLLSIMQIRFGNFEIVRTLYLKELAQIYSYIKKNPRTESMLKEELEKLGITIEHLKHILYALKNFEVDRYNKIVEDLGKRFCVNYRDGENTDFKVCVDEAISFHSLFAGVHSTFETLKIGYIPEVMVMKVAFSKTLVRAYGE